MPAAGPGRWGAGCSPSRLLQGAEPLHLKSASATSCQNPAAGMALPGSSPDPWQTGEHVGSEERGGGRRGTRPGWWRRRRKGREGRKEKRRRSRKVFPSSPLCHCAARRGGSGMGCCRGSREVEMWGRNSVQSADVAGREGHLTERNGKREKHGRQKVFKK